MFKFLIFCLLVSQSLAFWRTCPLRPSPRAVESPLCDATRCTLTRGQNLIGNVFFTPTAAHSNIGVFITADGTNIPVTPPNDNACNSLFRGGASVGCPTVPNAEHEWRLNIPIPLALPPMSGANFEVELVDLPSLSSISCFIALADLN